MGEGEKRPRGRPPKAPGESIARPNLSLRLHRDLYARLQAAAKRDGRSLGEEIERRLEESFALGSMQDRLADTVAQAVATALAKDVRNAITNFGPSNASKPPPITLAAYPSNGDVGSIVFER